METEIKISKSVELLNQVLAERQLRNSKYSLRAFSRDLGVEQSLLCKILKGKRKITPKQACKITSSLDLPAAEVIQFIYSTLDE